MTKNSAVAKYAGKIVEVRTYYNKDIEELSPSLQKFIKDQEKIASQRKNAAGNHSITDDPVHVNAPIRISGDKMSGEVVDGVLIIFFIQIEDIPGVGDKFTCSSPIKGVISRVFEAGEEPFDEEGDQIDYIMSSLSVVSRMTSDVFLTMWSNSILYDLKSGVLDIYND